MSEALENDLLGKKSSRTNPVQLIDISLNTVSVKIHKHIQRLLQSHHQSASDIFLFLQFYNDIWLKKQARYHFRGRLRQPDVVFC